MSLDYQVGQRLGDYEILGILGAGGMGKVYKVRNTISDRIEAMKILLPDLVGQKELADRFLREIKVLASLNHPNIAALRTALTLDNQLVMIMEFVDGVTLSSRLQEGAIAPGQAIKYVDQVLAALSYAHKQNIIHRDIKPANMMLTPDGAVKLMDFGIARSATDRSLTMTGTTLGSLNYMPPEQVKGEPADNRSDLYSLGVSLYELVTGQLPFQADSSYALMAAHLQEEPRPPIVLRPGIPQPLNQIILMALAKDPGQRFQSADAFRGALRNVVTHGETTQAAVAPRAYAPGSGAAASATALFQETPGAQSPTQPVASPMFQPQQTPQPTQRVTPAPSVAPVFASEPAAAPPPAAVAASASHRGLWIGLGALIVVAVLFAAGLYLPGHLKTLADWTGSSKKAAPADSSTAAPASATTPDGGATATPSTTQTPGDSSGSVSPASVAATPGSGASPTSAQSQPTGAATPATPDASATSAPAADTSSAASTAPSASSSASSHKKSSKAAKTSGSSAGAQSTSASQQTTAAPTSTDAVPQVLPEDANLAEEVEQQSTDVESRTIAVTQSLNNLKQQQAASGYGLRGDIVAAEQRMNADLAKANSFMRKQDAKSAKKYLDMAEGELQTIEKFLGH